MTTEGTGIDGLLRITTAPLALPAGLRDLLPPVAARRRARARSLLEQFSSWGYELVLPPAYERESSVTRGLSPRARTDLVRFVEPRTGDVVVLRPDMTPQIARIAATRFAARVVPQRFMYEGSVLRTPRGRTRRLRQIAQAGVELLGWSSVDADVEVISCALSALSSLGLSRVRVELSHAAIARELVALAPASHRELFIDALASRDLAAIARILGEGEDLEFVGSIVALAGDRSALDRASERRIGSRPALVGAVTELRAVLDGLHAAGHGEKVLVDLAEVRGLGYYTGVSFVLLADGVGEPVGGGGRYDGLLAEYGVDRPATGCALDLELLDEALAHQGVAPEPEPSPVLLIGENPARRTAAARLRALGHRVAEADPSALAAIVAESARFSAVLRCEGAGAVRVDAEDPRDWLSSE